MQFISDPPPYDKINHRLVNLSSNCDMKSGLSQFDYVFLPVQSNNP